MDELSDFLCGGFVGIVNGQFQWINVDSLGTVIHQYTMTIDEVGEYKRVMQKVIEADNGS
jgi:hypothetical protein